MTTATIIRYLRPQMSASCPKSGWKTIDARRNDVATHDEFGPSPKDLDIVGSAVLTTLPSNAERSIGMQMAVKHLQKPTPLAHSDDCSLSPGILPSSLYWSVVAEDVEDRVFPCLNGAGSSFFVAFSGIPISWLIVDSMSHDLFGTLAMSDAVWGLVFDMPSSCVSFVNRQKKPLS
jgi:hypothetical protein